MLRTVTATRYVTPLREGGSLPAILEADDQGLYVVKFRGAGQGSRALVAEQIAGEIARALGLRVPELVFVELDARLGRSEPDSEIRELLKASAGLNLALDYLPRSAMFDPVADPTPDPAIASEIVWFDAFVTNVDRTPKNPNLLTWHRELWLIDHGASLYFHHDWSDHLARSQSPFAPIRDHILLPFANALADADAKLRGRLTEKKLREIIDAVPDAWLPDGPVGGAAEQKQGYFEFLSRRLASSSIFVEEAERARAQLV